MRLIDADALKERMCDSCLSRDKHDNESCFCGKVLDIAFAPTAYDIDKVVDELGDAEYPYSIFDVDNCEVEESLLKAEMVESIVKRGGVDDSN